jgi:ubiquinone/menaquinone biosynthesis C-methylase UbiE
METAWMVDRTTQYYNQTAKSYDELHGGEENYEHIRSLEDSWPILEPLEIQSVFEIGCGTGRSLQWFQARAPHLRLAGLDPSAELLALAKSKLPEAELLTGKGESLPLPDGSHDLVIATGMMHHADRPRDVMREMFRVARKAVVISDRNNFAFGGTNQRWLRLWLYASHLLSAVTYVKQGFRKQGYSQDDGWWYPYSLLNDYGLIASLSSRLYLLPTRPTNSPRLGNFLLNQSHLAIVAIKELSIAS